MEAKGKLEKLINTWYGFGLFTSIATLVYNGIGLFSIVGAIISTFVGFCVTFVIGRLLLRGSSLMRIILLVGSAIGAVLGILAVGSSLYSFVTQWSFSFLLVAAYMLLGVWIYAKSFGVLTDKTVKAHFK